MPRRLKQDGTRIANVRLDKAWYDIPVKSDKIPKMTETYLIPTSVANYIEKIERQLKKYENRS